MALEIYIWFMRSKSFTHNVSLWAKFPLEALEREMVWMYAMNRPRNILKKHKLDIDSDKKSVNKTDSVWYLKQDDENTFIINIACLILWFTVDLCVSYSWRNTAPYGQTMELCLYEACVSTHFSILYIFVNATYLVSLGSTEALGTWNTNWSSLSFASLSKVSRKALKL